jgi:tetratricopeptide (TPR) repeat protein
MKKACGSEFEDCSKGTSALSQTLPAPQLTHHRSHLILKLLLLGALLFLAFVFSSRRAPTMPTTPLNILLLPSQKGDASYIFNQSLLAEIAMTRGQPDKALHLYLDVAKQHRNPYAAERAMQIALTLRAVPEITAAGQLWAELDNKNINAQLFALLALVKTSELADNKLAPLNRLLQLDNDSLSYYKKLVSELSERKQQETLLATVEQLQPTLGMHLKLLVAKALIHEKMGDIPQSLSYTEQALATKP